MNEKKIEHGKLNKDEILKFLIDELGGGYDYKYNVYVILDGENETFKGIEIRTKQQAGRVDRKINPSFFYVRMSTIGLHSIKLTH